MQRYRIAVIEPIIEATIRSCSIWTTGTAGSPTRLAAPVPGARIALHVAHPDPSLRPRGARADRRRRGARPARRARSGRPASARTSAWRSSMPTRTGTRSCRCCRSSSRAPQDGHEPPVVVVHDVRWPFGRRDGYRDPEAIPRAPASPQAAKASCPRPQGPDPPRAARASGTRSMTAPHGVRTRSRTSPSSPARLGDRRSARAGRHRGRRRGRAGAGQRRARRVLRPAQLRVPRGPLPAGSTWSALAPNRSAGGPPRRGGLQAEQRDVRRARDAGRRLAAATEAHPRRGRRPAAPRCAEPGKRADALERSSPTPRVAVASLQARVRRLRRGGPRAARRPRRLIAAASTGERESAVAETRPEALERSSAAIEAELRGGRDRLERQLSRQRAGARAAAHRPRPAATPSSRACAPSAPSCSRASTATPSAWRTPSVAAERVREQLGGPRRARERERQALADAERRAGILEREVEARSERARRHARPGAAAELAHHRPRPPARHRAGDLRHASCGPRDPRGRARGRPRPARARDRLTLVAAGPQDARCSCAA